jgi:hypothetical protein
VSIPASNTDAVSAKTPNWRRKVTADGTVAIQSAQYRNQQQQDLWTQCDLNQRIIVLIGTGSSESDVSAPGLLLMSQRRMCFRSEVIVLLAMRSVPLVDVWRNGSDESCFLTSSSSLPSYLPSTALLTFFWRRELVKDVIADDALLF